MNTLNPIVPGGSYGAVDGPQQPRRADVAQQPQVAAEPCAAGETFTASVADFGPFAETPATPAPLVQREAPPVSLLAEDGMAALSEGKRSPESRVIAEKCHAIVFGSGTNEQKADRISNLLIPAVETAATPDASWTKATPQQVRLFVLETLEHTEGIRGVGALRDMDWSQHDFEGDTSKFNPEITQFLAKPGRDASVKWAINEHNDAPHHALWNDPRSTVDDLKESGTDVINAWRMTRRVYDKPQWSWEKIERTIAADHEDGRMTAAQRDSLLAAIPFQQQYEASQGQS